MADAGHRDEQFSLKKVGDRNTAAAAATSSVITAMDTAAASAFDTINNNSSGSSSSSNNNNNNNESSLPPSIIVHQLLAGRDFAVLPSSDPKRSLIFRIAAQMANYVYCVVDKSTGGALLVDACWDIEGILSHLASLGVRANRIEACAYTHHHFDHTGGRLPRFMTAGLYNGNVRIDGITEVLNMLPHIESVCIGALDAEKAAKQCAVGTSLPKIRRLQDGDIVWESEDTVVSCWSTPGHTAGSVSLICSRQDAKSASPVIITGDTLFVGSCGRFDLPDSNPSDMLRSLARLSKLPDNTICFPGHNYSREAHTTIGHEASTNAMMVQGIRFANTPGALTREDTASAYQAYVLLPDYLSVARSALRGRLGAYEREKEFGSFHNSGCLHSRC